MKYFLLLVIVCTIFACGKCLKCYSCTHGQNSTLEKFGVLSECFYNEYDDICETDYDYCSSVIFDSNPETLTIMYTCAFNMTDIPHNATTVKCFSDFCNREQIMSSSRIVSDNFLLSNTPSGDDLETEFFEESTTNNVGSTTLAIEIKAGASSVIFSAYLSFFVLIMIIFV